MATIVEYADDKAPQNLYPYRIISPSRSGPCCFSDMEEIGGSRRDERWMYQYKRCRTCGFTVRVIVCGLPDLLLASNCELLAAAFQRNAPVF